MSSATPAGGEAGTAAPVRVYEGGFEADITDESKLDVVEARKEAAAVKAAKDKKAATAVAAIPEPELDDRKDRVYEGGATIETSFSPNVDTFEAKKAEAKRREDRDIEARKAALAKAEADRLTMLEAADAPPSGDRRTTYEGGLTEDTTDRTAAVDLVEERRAAAAKAKADADAAAKPKAVDTSATAAEGGHKTSLEGGWTEETAASAVSPSAAAEAEAAKAKALEAEARAKAAAAAELDRKVHSPTSGEAGRPHRSSSYDGGWTEDTTDVA